MSTEIHDKQSVDQFEFNQKGPMKHASKEPLQDMPCMKKVYKDK